MTLNAAVAGVLSFFIPGMGQIYAGKSKRGAAILIAVIVVGNLNAIWFSLYGLTKPVAGASWLYEIPRILHDLFAFYGIIFWIWQVVDAYQQVKPSVWIQNDVSSGNVMYPQNRNSTNSAKHIK